jgi:hypothetical protein
VNDDELLELLRRSDPTRGDSVEPAGGTHAAQLMEQIMNTTPDIETTAEPPSPRQRRRWPAYALGGVAAGVIALGIVALANDDDEGGDEVATVATFDLPAGDPMAMCLAVSEYQPDASVGGFRGTVSEVGADTVTFDVAKWYRGGDADQVVLSVKDMPMVALDGVEFQQGGDYLVAVMNGEVLICGLSGPYDATLAGYYDTWFGS